MKRISSKKWQANLTMLIMGGLLGLSIACGSHSYVVQRQKLIAEMDNSLQTTVENHAAQWLAQDTIRSYVDLQQKLAAQISVRAYDKTFAAALKPSVADNSGIQVQVLEKRNAGFENELSEGYLLSDTIVWMAPQHAANMAASPMISFRGYIRCTPWTILQLSDQTLSLTLLVAFIVCGLLFRVLRRKDEQPSEQNEAIAFGDLTLDMHNGCFLDVSGNPLHLTPMQYALMEMFYLSPTHQLMKRDICDSLWPGKENADDTLYTLMRRLKPIVEGHSRLHISTDRGKAYQLDIMN